MQSVDVVSRPSIRVRPVPPCDPPFDDELMPDVWAGRQPMLFDWPVRRPLDRHAPHDAPHHVGGLGTLPHPVGVQRPRHRPRTGVAVADARLAVRCFVGMCVEVLNGYRPGAHLRRLSAPKEALEVVAQGVAGARRVAELRRAADRPGGRRERRAGPGPVAVLNLRLCEPRPGAVEAAVLLVTGERTWAMALRLELQPDETWAATVLRLI